MHGRITTTKTLTLLFACVFFITACGGGGSDSGTGSAASPSTNPTATISAEDYRLAELDYIDAELRSGHPNPFFSRPENQYAMDFAELREKSTDMPVTQFRVEMAKFVADIGDQHTYIALPANDMKKFPVKIWWEDDRAIVIETDGNHAHLLGQELMSIDGTPTAFVKDPAMEYLAYQNEHWKDALSPNFMHLAAVLENEGIIASSDVASFVFEDIEGEQTFIDIDSKVVIDDWVRIEDTQDTPPLYRLSEDNYAYTVTDELLYIQYNSAFNSPAYSISAFIDDLEREMENEMITKVVVDIRFNYGGLIDHFVPVIAFLANSRFNASDSLFVLTGRNSFSSAIGAIYSFDELTEATFVGGPTGGKPNGFSYVLGVGFNGSGNAFYMATSYLELTPETVDSFYPEHQVLFTQQDFIDGRDPVIEFVQSF